MTKFLHPVDLPMFMHDIASVVGQYCGGEVGACDDFTGELLVSIKKNAEEPDSAWGIWNAFDWEEDSTTGSAKDLIRDHENVMECLKTLMMAGMETIESLSTVRIVE